MEYPKISVVTISFNQGAYLERAIESVTRQNYPNVEYIILDPGSTDNSREIIQSHREAFSKIDLSPDKGPADGLNKGLSACSGDLFYYLNSDDVVADGAFLEAATLFNKNPRVDVIYGNGFIINEEDKILRKVYSAKFFTPFLYASGSAVIVQQAAFIRTAALRAVGGFNIENKTCWDGEAFFDLAAAGFRFRRVWRDWGLFRVYPTTISGSGKFEERIKADHRRIIRKVSAYPLNPEQPFVKLGVRVLQRVIDVRRWRSYLKGSFKPTDATLIK